MLWFILLGALAAFGLLCCIYCIAGLFLSDDTRPKLVCLLPRNHHPDGAIVRYRLLRDLGLVQEPLLILGAKSENMGTDIEFCTVEELSARLELERTKLD